MYKTNDLVFNYLIFKTSNGYDPHISLFELRNLIDFMLENIELDINPNN